MAEQVTSPPSGPSGPSGPSADAPTPPPSPSEPSDAVSFTLDGRPATARRGEMLIAAAERAGTYIPRFCYHPRMKPVGMCRMCLVEVSGPRGATLQPACFIAASEGMEVTTNSDKVKKAQDGVLELLLVNHPLDCPVCDKGGECPLQDQTLAYGPGESRFVEEKRHFAKPIAISELVLLDRERCIQCARCTRFAEEVAGEAQIDLAGRGERVEVSTFPGRPFTSYFSGNTVQICPVGALTATPYRFTARPWDLEQVESTCTTCSFGCRVAVQSSANRLTRLLGIDADPVNQGWLCDKGRFVFEAVNGDEVAIGPDADEWSASGVAPATASAVEPLGAAPLGQFDGEAREVAAAGSVRLTEPLVRKDGELVPASWSEALSIAAEGLKAARSAGGPTAVAVIGGARSTNEGAYAWAKLAKAVIGTDSVDAQLGDGLPAELVLGLPRASIAETCSARTVLLLTGDVREELPVLYLRLRQAVLEGGTTLIELAPRPSSLTAYAAVHLPMRPGDAPALARALSGHGPSAAALAAHPEGAVFGPDDLARARSLLEAEGGDRPGSGVVVVLGRPSLAEHEGVVAEAALVLANALPGARFLPALRRGNIHGALDMGMSPGLLPGRVLLGDGSERFERAWGSVPSRRGRTTAQALASLAGLPESRGGASVSASGEPAAGDAGDRVRALVLLGSDLASDFPDQHLVRRAIEAAEVTVVVTGHRSSVVAGADVVLPAAVEHERAGTTTNVEGRVSRLAQKLVAPGLARPDWMIAAELAFELGGDLGLPSAAEVWREIEEVSPAYAGVTAELLESAAARDGVVVPLDRHAPPTAPDPIDPMALPGVESVERQGAPARVGSAEVVSSSRSTSSADALEAGRGGDDVDEGSADDPAALSASPGPASPGPASPGSAPAPHIPSVDSYSLRLLSMRRLYDGGSGVGGSPSLVPLVGTATARANPYDLDRLGARTGDPVRVRSASGALVLPAEADAEVPKGVVSIDFNLPVPGGAGDGAADDSGEDDRDRPWSNAAASLVDCLSAVTEVRLESVR